MGTKIVCDSTAYIPCELLKEYAINIVSLNIIKNNQSKRENEIDLSNFYEELSGSKELPTSSQPSLDEMYQCFEKCIIDGSSVAAIFISSEMSGTFSSAHLAKNMILEKYPDAKLEIIDSRSNCMQLGFSVLEAAKAAREGKELAEVVEAAASVIQKSRFLFVPDTLEYLKKGGRIGGASALIGALLQIRPILTVKDGKTSVFDKVRTKKRAIDKIVETLINEVNVKGLSNITVHHINCEEEGLQLAERLERILKIPVSLCSIGPVIGLHVGPGTVGVVYCTKK